MAGKAIETFGSIGKANVLPRKSVTMQARAAHGLQKRVKRAARCMSDGATDKISVQNVRW